MSEFMSFMISMGIGIGILIVQQLLSRREHFMLGSVLPITSLLLTIGVFYSGTVVFSIRNLMPYMILIILQISIWEEGRRKVKEMKELELNKMKSRDL